MRVLFIGLGGIGQRHLRIIRKLNLPNLEIIAFRERGLTAVINDRLNIESDLNIEKLHNIQVFTKLEEALAQNPEVTFVCNPTSKHLAVAISAANHGSDLFIEKALSNSMEGVSNLIEVSNRKNLICTVGYQMRFHPCLKELKQILDAHELGRVIAVNAEVGEFMPAWHKYEDYRDLYAAKKELGGGVITSQIHELDYLYWLFGPPKKIFALGGHLSNLEIDVEDVASTLMSCTYDGLDIPIHLHQDYLQQPTSRVCKVIGEDGIAVIDFVAVKLMQYKKNGELIKEKHFRDFDRNQLFLEQMENFFECVKIRRQPLVTLEDAAVSLKVALAIKKSLSTGLPTTVEI